jgi:hypothetical protein
MNIKRTIREEVGDLDWAKNWANDLPTVGDEYNIHIYDDMWNNNPVRVRIIAVTSRYVRWKILDDHFLEVNRDMFLDVEDGEEFLDPFDSMSLDGFMELWGHEPAEKINENLGSDWGWAEDVVSYHHVINKAFEFNPPAEDWDGLELDYEKLIDYLISLGFESKYNTPRILEGDEMAVGVYAYRDSMDGSLQYVYTTGVDEEIDEDYYMHIRGYATGESEDKGENLQVVDARQFVRDMGL